MYNIKPMGKGVELTSTSLPEFVKGITELFKDSYNINENSIVQKGMMFILYANKSNEKKIPNKKGKEKVAGEDKSK